MRGRIKGALIATMAIVAALTVCGCSQGTTQQTTEPESASEAASSIPGNLTKQVECAGVSLKIDPSWRDNTDQKTSLRFDPSSGSVVATHVYANGETATLDSFKQINGVMAVDYTVEREWDKDGISYSIISGESNNGDVYSYMFGCDENGVGFYVYFNLGNMYATDANMAVRDALFDSVSFSPEDALTAIHEVNGVGATEKEETQEPSQSATVGQSNALSMAHDYLKSMPFSYSGLIEQLEYEGFTNEEARYAADNCNADWNEQAAKMAKDYLDSMSFSRAGLIEQLQYEGFSAEQAEYGASAVGY